MLGARTKGQDFNQIFYQPTETIITALTVSKLKVEKEFLSLTKKISIILYYILLVCTSKGWGVDWVYRTFIILWLVSVGNTVGGTFFKDFVTFITSVHKLFNNKWFSLIIGGSLNVRNA